VAKEVHALAEESGRATKEVADTIATQQTATLNEMNVTSRHLTTLAVRLRGSISLFAVRTAVDSPGQATGASAHALRLTTLEEQSVDAALARR
jgi:methyl-accepting chemotaxis protein